VYGSSRARFLAGLGLAACGAAGLLRDPPEAEAASPRDVDLLRFDLAFEYLQSAFYTEADRVGTVDRMSRPKRAWAEVLGAHERAHVRILRQVLGRAARPSPYFDFHGVTEREASFVATAVAMEDLTVALLLGQVARFQDRRLVAAVFSLLTVEARHAAWARDIDGFTASPAALDEPQSLAAVSRRVAATHFVARRPRTSTRKAPAFTG
jgi:hypothetical protein